MITNISKEVIKCRIINIFEKLFDIIPNDICSNYESENLLGRKFSLRSRDLLYLFFEIEREFDIKISEQSILNGDFQYINRIIEVILTLKCGEETEKVCYQR